MWRGIRIFSHGSAAERTRKKRGVVANRAVGYPLGRRPADRSRDKGDPILAEVLSAWIGDFRVTARNLTLRQSWGEDFTVQTILFSVRADAAATVDNEDQLTDEEIKRQEAEGAARLWGRQPYPDSDADS